jgi:XTP/dITP diphosphohydrolase
VDARADELHDKRELRLQRRHHEHAATILPRPPPMTTILIATRNEHKVGEIRAILGGQFHYLTLKDFPDAPAVIEDADTFAGNAMKKATELARRLGEQNSKFKIQNLKLFVLADDSGLEVDALNGAPSVHSARFAALDSGAEGNSKDADNNAKLLLLLKDVPLKNRIGRFRCVIALVELNSKLETRNSKLFDGTCEGRIEFALHGAGGFGYDPLFVPDGFEKSFAELGDETKNQISHRAKALAKLKDYFTNNPSR